MGSVFSRRRRCVSTSKVESHNATEQLSHNNGSPEIQVQSSLPTTSKEEVIALSNENHNSSQLTGKRNNSNLPHDSQVLPFCGINELQLKNDIDSTKLYDNMVSVPPKTDEDGNVVENHSRWTATELYNILIAESWLGKPQLLDLDYLLLLDCRNHEEYQKSHIITAKHHKSLETDYGCLLSVPGQLESFHMIVVYNDDSGHISELLQSRNISFNVLNLSYQVFQKKYPFLCNDAILNNSLQRQSSLQTWPSEICNGQIYQGTAKQASDSSVVQHLGITHVINVTLDQPNAFPDTVKYMRIQLDDEKEVDLLSWLSKTTKFISEALSIDGNSTSNSKNNTNKGNNRVLIHCNMGRSRSSTVMLAYLMEIKRWSLRDASDWLKECRQTAKPNVGFLNQLLLYEEKLFGRKISKFNELPF